MVEPAFFSTSFSQRLPYLILCGFLLAYNLWPGLLRMIVGILGG